MSDANRMAENERRHYYEEREKIEEARRLEATIRRIVREELLNFSLHGPGCPQRFTSMGECTCLRR